MGFWVQGFARVAGFRVQGFSTSVVGFLDFLGILGFRVWLILKPRLLPIFSLGGGTRLMLDVDSPKPCSTHRPLSSSFLGLPCRILNVKQEKELLRGPWGPRGSLSWSRGRGRVLKLLLMIYILHYLKDPEQWEVGYIPYYLKGNDGIFLIMGIAGFISSTVGSSGLQFLQISGVGQIQRPNLST